MSVDNLIGMISDLQKRIDKLESKNKMINELKAENEKIKNDLIPLIKKVISWHVHGSNGKMYWELPPEIRKEQEELLKQMINGKIKSTKFSDSIEKSEDSLKFFAEDEYGNPVKMDENGNPILKMVD